MMDTRLRIALSETIAVVLKSGMLPSMTMPVANSASDFESVRAGGVERLWLIPRMEMWMDESPDIRTSVWLSESARFVSLNAVEVETRPLVGIVQGRSSALIPGPTEKKYFWTLIYLDQVKSDSTDMVCGFLELLREQALAH